MDERRTSSLKGLIFGRRIGTLLATAACLLVFFCPPQTGRADETPSRAPDAVVKTYHIEGPFVVENSGHVVTQEDLRIYLTSYGVNLPGDALLKYDLPKGLLIVDASPKQHEVIQTIIDSQSMQHRLKMFADFLAAQKGLNTMEIAHLVYEKGWFATQPIYSQARAVLLKPDQQALDDFASGLERVNKYVEGELKARRSPDR